MNGFEKLTLVRNIAKFLASKYSFEEIYFFLKSDGLKPRGYRDYVDEANGKENYIMNILEDKNESVLLRVVEELELNCNFTCVEPPKIWEDTFNVKAFISHTHERKDIAERLKEILSLRCVDAFVAHKDIEPCEEWQKEIDRALRHMDFFISIHTKGFKEKFWCHQEIGYALSRNKKIIPLKLDEDPVGFIAKIQAVVLTVPMNQELSQTVVNILENDSQTAHLAEICKRP